MSDLLADLARDISAQLKPGQEIRVDGRWLFSKAPAVRLMGPLGPLWSPIDQIMEKIAGSAFEITVHHDPVENHYIFQRLRAPLEDDRRTYVSPDRRHLFQKDASGCFAPISQATH